MGNAYLANMSAPQSNITQADQARYDRNIAAYNRSLFEPVVPREPVNPLEAENQRRRDFEHARHHQMMPTHQQEAVRFAASVPTNSLFGLGQQPVLTPEQRSFGSYSDLSQQNRMQPMPLPELQGTVPQMPHYGFPEAQHQVQQDVQMQQAHSSQTLQESPQIEQSLSPLTPPHGLAQAQSSQAPTHMQQPLRMQSQAQQPFEMQQSEVQPPHSYQAVQQYQPLQPFQMHPAPQGQHQLPQLQAQDYTVGWVHTGGARVDPQQQLNESYLMVMPPSQPSFTEAGSLMNAVSSFNYQHLDPEIRSNLHNSADFGHTIMSSATTQVPRHDSGAVGAFRTFNNQGNGSISLAGPMYSASLNLTNQAQSPDSDTLSPKSEAPTKVAIPRNNNGPAMKNYNVPARVKPGRKPLDTDPDDKRKSQNRQAQRNFRDRRAQKVHELEVLLREDNERHERAFADVNGKLAAQIRETEMWKQRAQESETWKQKAESWQKKAQALEQSLEDERQRRRSASPAEQHRYTSYTAQPTPPEEVDVDYMETDYTNFFASKKPVFSHDHGMDSEDFCGFCSMGTACLCRMRPETADDEPQKLAPISGKRATLPLSIPALSSTPSYLEAPTRATGPGQCDACLQDPERARQCQELARSTQFSNSQQSALIKAATATAMNPNSSAEARMSCDDFLKTAKEKNLHLGSRYLERVHVYPYSHRGSGAGSSHSPAMEIDAQDAAQALADMSRGEVPRGAMDMS